MNAGNTLLKVENIETYYGNVKVLRGISFEVNEGQIVTRDAMTALRLLDKKTVFDCIFMDPPYEQGIEKDILKQLINSNLIHPSSLIVVESSMDTDFDYLEDMGYALVKQKKYKTNQHLFIRRKED